MDDEQQFYVGPDHFIVHDVFLSVFWWLYCYNKHGQEHTFPSIVTVLVAQPLSTLIVTIDPSKDTEIHRGQQSSPVQHKIVNQQP